MAQVTRQSPYTTPGTSPSGIDPDRLAGSLAYAVPDSLDSARAVGPYAHGDNGGTAQQVHESTTGTPDASRLRHTTLFETRVGEGEPVAWYRRMFRDLFARHSVEYQDADGFAELKEPPARMVPRPRPSDTGEPRPTTRMSPHAYVFTRPFPGMGTSGHLNGSHFSMADNKRTYSILGMEPPRKMRRNTYRLEPEPWDTDLVDMPVTVDSSPDAGTIAVIDVPNASRSWRL